MVSILGAFSFFIPGVIEINALPVIIFDYWIGYTLKSGIIFHMIHGTLYDMILS